MADGFTFTPELDAQVAEAAALLREARAGSRRKRW